MLADWIIVAALLVVAYAIGCAVLFVVAVIVEAVCVVRARGPYTWWPW